MLMEKISALEKEKEKSDGEKKALEQKITELELNKTKILQLLQ